MKHHTAATRTLVFHRYATTLLILRTHRGRIQSTSVYKYDPDAGYVVVSLKAVSRHTNPIKAAHAAKAQVHST